MYGPKRFTLVHIYIYKVGLKSQKKEMKTVIFIIISSDVN